MAFSLSLWDKLSAAGNGSVRTLWGYSDSATALATLAASAYFNDVSDHLVIGDSIFMLGSDGNGQYEITAVSPNVTMSAATDPGALSESLATNLVFVGSAGGVATGVAMSGDVAILASGATAIQAASVDLAMLSAGITPSHVVKYAAQATTSGGAAAEAITVTGAAATDLAFVQMVDDGTNNTTIINAVVTLNTLTVTFSADPGADAVINYQLLRAAA